MPEFALRSDTQIDWTNHTNGTNDFTNRLADAFMGNTLFSDMTFFLESDRISIPAHSLIVSAASPVLDRCLNGTGTGTIINTDRIITVPDCALAEFKVMLRYIYTGCVEDLLIETAAVLLPVAHYYDLRFLEQICADCITKNLSKTNVCATFTHIYEMDNPAVIGKCMELMQLHMDEMLLDGSMMDMPDEVLKHLLNKDSFSGTSLVLPTDRQLFESMLLWATKECLEDKVEATAANRRLKMKDRLPMIRFAAMTGDEFFKCLSCVGIGFFTEEEISGTFLRITVGPEYTATPIAAHFSCKSRVFRLKVNQEATPTPLGYVGDETINTKNTSHKWYVVGFETDANVTEIWNRLRTHKLEFTKIGRRIVFKKPFLINIFFSTFVLIVSKADLTKFVRRAVSLEDHPNVCLIKESLSVISAYLIRVGSDSPAKPTKDQSPAPINSTKETNGNNVQPEASP